MTIVVGFVDPAVAAAERKAVMWVIRASRN
jgi:hypothetical protein